MLSCTVRWGLNIRDASKQCVGGVDVCVSVSVVSGGDPCAGGEGGPCEGLQLGMGWGGMRGEMRGEITSEIDGCMFIWYWRVIWRLIC